MKPLLVGESNPFGGDPGYALWPEPAGCSGDRLCRFVLGMERMVYLRTFDRVNLLQLRPDERWSMPRARVHAEELRLRMDFAARPAVILLGAKVQAAFGLKALSPFAVVQVAAVIDGSAWKVVILPHPTGLCRVWDQTGAVDRARRALRGAMPSLPIPMECR